MDSIIDILFPKSCSICSRRGSYLCDRCKKLFKRSLPECYVCRRISNDFHTHIECINYSKECYLNSIFVAWEYNSLSSDILKRFKFSSVYDIGSSISEFFLDCILDTPYMDVLRGTLLVNVPISFNRLNDRGFNQTEEIGMFVGRGLGVEFSSEILGRHFSYGHQSLRDATERYEEMSNTFFVKKKIDICKYRSITIVDDVITTGRTLEMVTSVLRKEYGVDTVVNGLCMFRGKPYYISSDSESFSKDDLSS